MSERRGRIVEGVVTANVPAGEEAFVLTWAYGREHAWDYAPGEFVQLSAWTGRDPLLRRPFSILDRGTLDDRAWAQVLYLTHGRGTRLLAGLRPGDRVSELGPLGNRFGAPSRPGPVILVAGGVGVAPFLLYTRELVAAGREVIALLGARSASRLTLVRELEREGARVAVATDVGDAGTKGLVTTLLERELEARGPAAIGAVATCGPEPMLRAVHAICLRAGVPGEASLERRMACGFGVCFTCVCKLRDEKTGAYRNKRTCLEGPVVPFQALPLEAW